MTVISVCQQLSAFIGIERPSSVMASTEQTGMELAALAKECGEQLAECYPWQKLKVLHTITGNGSSTEFDLPSDFGWIPINQQMRTADGAYQFEPDHDRWLDMSIRSEGAGLNTIWTVIGDEIKLLGPIEDDVEAKFYYISNLWALDAVEDQPQNGFLADEDTFRLSETLLRLCMMWKWKAYKGLPYAEEMATFERELNKRIFYDRPRNMVRLGGPVYRGGYNGADGDDLTFAFPYTLPFDVG